ncbi:MAG: hypothetical protein IPJ47_10040 [Anaerolineales bacterium]|nr:hypothetical protein [Anaerolineales bacterium]
MASRKSDEQPSEVSCLRISALRNGKIDCADTKSISMTIEAAKQYRVQVNDVFIVRGNGSKELVGRAGLIDECKNIDFSRFVYQNSLDETKILPTFFVAWWNHLL